MKRGSESGIRNRKLFFFLRDFPLRFDGSSIVYVITAELWPLWISNTEAPNVKHKRFRVC